MSMTLTEPCADAYTAVYGRLLQHVRGARMCLSAADLRSAIDDASAGSIGHNQWFEAALARCETLQRLADAYYGSIEAVRDRLSYQFGRQLGTTDVEHALDRASDRTLAAVAEPSGSLATADGESLRRYGWHVAMNGLIDAVRRRNRLPVGSLADQNPAVGIEVDFLARLELEEAFSPPVLDGIRAALVGAPLDDVQRAAVDVALETYPWLASALPPPPATDRDYWVHLVLRGRGITAERDLVILGNWLVGLRHQIAADRFSMEEEAIRKHCSRRVQTHPFLGEWKRSFARVHPYCERDLNRPGFCKGSIS